MPKAIEKLRIDGKELKLENIKSVSMKSASEVRIRMVDDSTITFAINDVLISYYNEGGERIPTNSNDTSSDPYINLLRYMLWNRKEMRLWIR